MKTFREWLKKRITETTTSVSVSGTMSGDIAQYKMPIGVGLVRRNWPYKKNKKR